MLFFDQDGHLLHKRPVNAQTYYQTCLRSAYAQALQSIHWSYTQSMKVDE